MRRHTDFLGQQRVIQGLCARRAGKRGVQARRYQENLKGTPVSKPDRIRFIRRKACSPIALRRDLLRALDDGQTRKTFGETFAELGNLVVHSRRDVTHVTPLCSSIS
jgi:hypothetical protein